MSSLTRSVFTEVSPSSPPRRAARPPGLSAGTGGAGDGHRVLSGFAVALISMLIAFAVAAAEGSLGVDKLLF